MIDQHPLPRLLIERDEAAKMLCIGTTLLDQLVSAGEIPSIPLGKRRLFYPEALKRYVEQLAYQTTDGDPA